MYLCVERIGYSVMRKQDSLRLVAERPCAAWRLDGGSFRGSTTHQSLSGERVLRASVAVGESPAVEGRGTRAMLGRDDSAVRKRPDAAHDEVVEHLHADTSVGDWHERNNPVWRDQG